MKFLSRMKDGGPESTVTGYFLVEIKSLFSIVLLHFEHGSRDAYHEHAFHAVSWLLRGRLTEYHMLRGAASQYRPSVKPIVTRRETFHKVVSHGDSWVLSFRGPWCAYWREYRPRGGTLVWLTYGRQVVRRAS